MMVVKVYMWPGGDQTREWLMTQATFSLLGRALRDAPELGVVRGERSYRVQLLKDTSFGGPADGKDVRPRQLRKRDVWREILVRGHRPGGKGRAARGVWDLVGGALGVMLGSRIDTIVEMPAEATP